MFRSPKSGALTVAFLCFTSPILAAGPLGIGEIATPEMIAGWDIDVRPDGRGLPPGEGSVADGEGLYEAKCASCHGLFGEGAGRWPILAGGEGTLDTAHPEKTVGSYWPYASTLWDYIHRAMPYPAPQSLTDDEVYAITAYVLYLNDIVDDDFILNQETFQDVKMPNEPNFYIDDRPDVVNTRCMSGCADASTFEIVTTINGVTPTAHFKEDSGVAANHYGNEASAEATKVALSSAAVAGESIYAKACNVCHGAGVAGAPVTGDAAAWSDRIAQGMAVLNRHAIEGYVGKSGVMPAKGGNMSLADEDVANAVAFMVESSQ